MTMGTCSKIQQIIDELEFDRWPAQATEHLAGCAECRRHLDQTNNLSELLRETKRVVAPDDFDLRLRARLNSISRRPQGFWAFVPTPALAVAAAVVLTAAIALAVFQQQTNDVDNNANTVAAGVVDKTGTNPKDNATPASEKAITPNEPANNAVMPTYASVGRISPVRRAEVIMPGVTLMLRDSRNGEKVVRVPQVIIGSQTVMPKTRNQRINYDATVF